MFDQHIHDYISANTKIVKLFLAIGVGERGVQGTAAPIISQGRIPSKFEGGAVGSGGAEKYSETGD